MYARFMSRLCELAYVPGVTPSRLAELLGKTVAAVYGQTYCEVLCVEGKAMEALPLLADSKRLIRAVAYELRSVGTPEAVAAARDLEKLVLSHIVRQEAWTLSYADRQVLAVERLVEVLKVDLFAPMADEAEFKDFCENVYNHSFSQRLDEWTRRLSEGDPEAASGTPAPSQRFRERALVDLPTPTLELLTHWIESSHSQETDSEDLAERLFSELDAAYPRNAFVQYYWGEARRLVSVVKYGTRPGTPHVPSMDRAREKFEEAYGLDPELRLAAFRVSGLLMASAVGLEDREEIGRRFGRAAEIQRGAALGFVEENLPELFADLSGSRQQVGRDLEESDLDERTEGAR